MINTASPGLVAAYLVSAAREVEASQSLSDRSFWALSQARRRLTLERDELAHGAPAVSGAARAQLVAAPDSDDSGFTELLLAKSPNKPGSEAELVEYLDQALALIAGVEDGDVGAAGQLQRLVAVQS